MGRTEQITNLRYPNSFPHVEAEKEEIGGLTGRTDSDAEPDFVRLSYLAQSGLVNYLERTQMSLIQSPVDMFCFRSPDNQSRLEAEDNILDFYIIHLRDSAPSDRSVSISI